MAKKVVKDCVNTSPHARSRITQPGTTLMSMYVESLKNPIMDHYHSSTNLVPHHGRLWLGVEGVPVAVPRVPEAAALVAVLGPQDGAVLPPTEAHLLHH